MSDSRRKKGKSFSPSRRMYRTEEACADNETLARRIRDGDAATADLLLSRNEGFLTDCAARFCRQYHNSAMLEDLKQEGAVALIDAAGRFDTGRGVQFLSYAGSAVRAAMDDYISKAALPVTMPPDRFRQLRRVTEIIAAEDGAQDSPPVLQRVRETLDVSVGVARKLVAEYRMLLCCEELSEESVPLSYGGDPARAIDLHMRKKLAVKLMGEVLTARERNVVACHLGIGQEREMTFEELAVRLNYNDPSAPEKAFQRAIHKLQEHRDESELGVWIRAVEAIREAQREEI